MHLASVTGASWLRRMSAAHHPMPADSIPLPREWKRLTKGGRAAMILSLGVE